jgi:acetyltransferase-like isoleucine patch superfamily enzyme
VILSSLINLAQNIYLPLVRGTPFIIWFYRGMGATIGKGTVITTTRIFDCDLLEIGKNCVIGGGVAISAHTGERRQGMLKKVVIGDHVTIGADTYIMPGTVIEDHVVVGANSMIPKGARLSAKSVYGGIPVRKIEGELG